MFTEAQRARLRDELVAAARADARIGGAAVTGSGAAGLTDRWSDIDLALSVETDLDGVVADWTGRMYRANGAVHHLDVFRGDTRFRVFLLDSTLQVDIAFWPATEFGAIAPTFRLLFGTANRRPPTPRPDAAELIGLGWLYALHARSSLARGRLWQAEFMISTMRDHVLALACVRHGVPAGAARGVDALPAPVLATLAGGLVRSLDAGELRRAFGVVTEGLLIEIDRVDPALAGRLAAPLRELAG